MIYVLDDGHRRARSCCGPGEDCRTPQCAPSEYLRRLYFDSLVYTPEGLQALVAAAGADRVLLGTDFPFDMGVSDPLQRLHACSSLSADDRVAIAGTTAARLLGIEHARSRSGPHGADDGRGIWFGLVPLPGGSYMNYENERRGHRR